MVEIATITLGVIGSLTASCTPRIVRDMDVDFEDASLRRLETDPAYTAGFDAAIVKAFRKRLQFIRAALDERAFYAMKSLHYEKLKGNLDGQSSMRLNDQWRLLLRLRQNEDGKTVVVISIADYH
jgi:proteic killer suppression protein